MRNDSFNLDLPAPAAGVAAPLAQTLRWRISFCSRPGPIPGLLAAGGRSGLVALSCYAGRIMEQAA
jgi:hypothetical protein